MWNFFGKRAKEGSTWAGLGAAIAGLGMLIPGVSDSGAAVVADAVSGAGASYLATGDWLGGLVVALGGLAALIKDKD